MKTLQKACLEMIIVLKGEDGVTVQVIKQSTKISVTGCPKAVHKKRR